MSKRDPYGHQQRWENWKERTKKDGKVEGILNHNFKLMMEYLEDMELGKNVSPYSSKGARSHIRLNTIREKMLFYGKHFNKIFEKLTQDDVHKFFDKMSSGKIKKKDGNEFKSPGMYVKDFKAFWGWMMRTGKVKVDIAQYLSKKEGSKPPWVYLTEAQFKKFANSLNPFYRMIAWLQYDSGQRVTEGNSIQVKDFSDGYTKLMIHPEKTKNNCGRKIKLKLCGSLVKEYVESNGLKPDDYIFSKNVATINQTFRRKSKELFGDKESPARKTFDKFTLYDIRHNSACYWLNRYPSFKGIMYRLGWKKESEVHYYAEFLGLSDKLTDDDMVTAEEKNKFETELLELKENQEAILKGFDLLLEVNKSRKLSKIEKEKMEKAKALIMKEGLATKIPLEL